MVTITRESINVKDLGGFIDDRIFKDLKISADLAEKIGCQPDNVTINALSTNMVGDKFQIKSKVEESFSDMTTALESLSPLPEF